MTRKPIHSRVQWSEDEVESLVRLYNEFKDAHEPVTRIREHFGTKKSTRNIIAKIMDLGLCDDRKKLGKKGASRKRRNEDEMQKSSSESDSALEDSSSGEEEEEEGPGDDGGATTGPTKAVQLVNLLKNMLATTRDDSEGTIIFGRLAWNTCFDNVMRRLGYSQGPR